MPLIVRFCKEEDDELREYCLQAFESFVKRCPKEILPFMPEVRGFVSSVLLNIEKFTFCIDIYLFNFAYF